MRSGRDKLMTRGGEAPAHRRILGLRVSALLETAGFLAVALAADALLGGGDRFAGIAPHPFWIVVLLVAAQYGTSEGLVAALLASAALLAGNLPEQGFEEDLYSWLLRASTEPLLWFAAALVLGGIRDAHRRDRDGLAQALQEERLRAHGLGEAYDQLSRLKEHLEAKVAGQVRTVHSMYLASRAIERQDTGQVLVGIRQLVRSVMDPTKFSLFLLEGRVLEAAVSEGWTDDDRFACELGAASPLFQAVVEHRRFLTAATPSHGLVLGEEGLLAGPLTCAETGEVIGMLKIEDIAFLDLNPSSVQNFRVLCEWIGSAYANARQVEESLASRYFDHVRRLMPAPLFEIARATTAALAERCGAEASAVYVGIGLESPASPGAQVAAARLASRLAGRMLDPVELRFDWRHDGWDVALLLPGTGPAAAEAVARRFAAELAKEIAGAGLQAAIRHAVQPLAGREGLASLRPSAAE